MGVLGLRRGEEGGREAKWAPESPFFTLSQGPGRLAFTGFRHNSYTYILAQLSFAALHTQEAISSF